MIEKRLTIDRRMIKGSITMLRHTIKKLKTLPDSYLSIPITIKELIKSSDRLKKELLKTEKEIKK